MDENRKREVIAIASMLIGPMTAENASRSHLQERMSDEDLVAYCFETAIEFAKYAEKFMEEK